MIVLKFGGNALAGSRDNSWLDLIASYYATGEKLVLVHGGGPQIDAEAKIHGIEKKLINGLRVTDQLTLEIVEMVLVGKVGQQLVRYLNAKGCRAIGLSGSDANLLIGEKKLGPSGEDLGFVGEVRSVNVEILNLLEEKKVLPVISSVSADKSGQALNVNADLAAGAIAGALEADRVIFMTDVSGLYRDFPDPDSLIESLSFDELNAIRNQFSDGMAPKVEAVLNALSLGARSAQIIDGRTVDALERAMANQPVGTVITNEK
jgi:acetylglutamate kinase